MKFFKATPPPLGSINTKMLEAWKVRHGMVYEVAAGDKIAFFRDLTKREVQNSISQIAKSDPVEMAYYFLTLTWLGGDSEFVSDPKFKAMALDILGKNFENSIRKVYPCINELIK